MSSNQRPISLNESSNEIITQPFGMVPNVTLHLALARSSDDSPDEAVLRLMHSMIDTLFKETLLEEWEN